MTDVYVRISDEPVAKTDSRSNGTLNVDLDRYGVPVGVEVLGALEVQIDGVVCRCAPTPSAAPTQISEDVFLNVVKASGDWENWDGNQIAAAVARARRVLANAEIEVLGD